MPLVHSSLKAVGSTSAQGSLRSDSQALCLSKSSIQIIIARASVRKGKFRDSLLA